MNFFDLAPASNQMIAQITDIFLSQIHASSCLVWSCIIFCDMVKHESRVASYELKA